MFYTVSVRFKYFYTHRGWMTYLAALTTPESEDLLCVERDQLLLELAPCPVTAHRSHLLCNEGIACVDVASALSALALKEIT